MSTIVYYAIPFFLLTLLLEARALRGRRRVSGYEPRDTGASLAMGLGNVLIAALAKAAVVPLGWLFNTPSHHRVHHGRNPQYLDRNYAGILILWDRLFGSFEAEAEDEAVDYGLTHQLESFDPITIAFHEWRAIGRDLLRAGSLRDALGLVFRAPGWEPNGSGATAADLRARHLAHRKVDSLRSLR